MTVRRASTYMTNDPYTLNICLDRTQEARGTLYIDDEKSYAYRSGSYIYLNLRFIAGLITIQKVDPTSSFSTAAVIERIEIAGMNVSTTPTVALLVSGTEEVTASVTKVGNAIVITNTKIDLSKDWIITLSSSCRMLIGMLIFWQILFMFII